MCGICGFANYKNDGLLKAMTDRILHRGPDEDGYFSYGVKLSMGMRRLKIIDLSTGSQPISNEDGTVNVVFNGEIYNFRELRADLEAAGHRFRTRSDTEVLVHLYEEHGADMPVRLRGMFAFAIWDSRTETLLLARDHFGIKPLFYSLAGDKLFFASEMKSLLLCPEIGGELDYQALGAYFAKLYIPAPLTAYKNIRKLEPAGRLVFRGGTAKVDRYWALPGRAAGAPSEEAEYLEAADDLLRRSVEEQLVSDVPLGLLLSGGMDSSCALYYMSRALKAPVKTFTIGYGPKDATFNETAAARLLAEHFRTEHHEKLLEPEVRGVMEKLAAQFDEPFADASAIPTYLVTREARREVTVALTGIGGDELFGGYPRHIGARLLPAYLAVPRPLRAAAGALAGLLPESAASTNIPGRVKRFLRGGRAGFREGYEAWMSYFTPEELCVLCGPGLAATRGTEAFELQDGPLGPDGVAAFELRNYLPDDLLTLADRASMANSLELRVPFLDVRLAELMAAAPLALKTRGFRLKYLLKKLMAGRLPPEIISGAKRGFQVPLARWYNEEIKDFADEVLNPSALKKSGFLSPEYVQGMLAEHRSGRRNLNDQIYAAMMFELWLAGNKARAAAGYDPVLRVSSRPLNIVIGTDIIQDDDEGGSGRVAWELALRLARFGHNVTVVTKGAPGKKAEERIDGVELRRYYGGPLKLRRILADVRARHGRIDALELHHPYTAALCMLFSGGAPAVYNFHSPWGREYAIRAAAAGRSFAGLGAWLRKLIEKAALRRSAVVLNASRFMAAELQAEHGMGSRLLPLGVDISVFTPGAGTGAARRRLGLPEDRFTVFTVRNLEPRMGLENLVDAAAAVAAERPDVLFIIGGRGSLSGALAARIKERGLSGSVRLAGYIPEADLADHYRSADLFVLPTKELEGFGLVTLEALACGAPVLATPVGANAEVLGAFGPEFLLKDCSAESIAAGIAGFMRGPGADPGLRARCRRFVEENYSWEKYAAGVEKELYRAAGGGANGR